MQLHITVSLILKGPDFHGTGPIPSCLWLAELNNLASCFQSLDLHVAEQDLNFKGEMCAYLLLVLTDL